MERYRMIVNMSFDRVRRGPVFQGLDQVNLAMDVIETHFQSPHWRDAERTPDRLTILSRGHNTPRRVQVWFTKVGTDLDAQVDLEDVLDWDWDLNWRERDQKLN